MKTDKAIRYTLLALLTLAIALALFVPWQCAHAQSREAVSVALNPTPDQAIALQALYGDDYLTIMHDALREHVRNRVHEGRMKIRESRAALLESPEMKPEEKQEITTTLEAVKSREEVK
jgi:hypothetical protein